MGVYGVEMEPRVRSGSAFGMEGKELTLTCDGPGSNDPNYSANHELPLTTPAQLVSTCRAEHVHLCEEIVEHVEEVEEIDGHLRSRVASVRPG